MQDSEQPSENSTTPRAFTTVFAYKSKNSFLYNTVTDARKTCTSVAMANDATFYNELSVARN